MNAAEHIVTPPDPIKRLVDTYRCVVSCGSDVRIVIQPQSNGDSVMYDVKVMIGFGDQWVEVKNATALSPARAADMILSDIAEARLAARV
jgi:hypothetical protein